MKLKALLISALAVAVAIPSVAGAAKGGTTRDSITGGGQAFFDAREPAGAGDTIAFTAKRAKGASTDSTAAEGQIQVRRRGATNAVKFHGEFSCLVVNSDGDRGWAFASGAARDGTPFELFVEDGGKGQLERNDMIMLFYGEETANNDDGQGESVCGFSSPEFDTVSMARGNVQARNRSTSEDAEPQNEQSQGASQTSAVTSLLGL